MNLSCKLFSWVSLLFSLLAVCSCKRNNSLFLLVPSSKSGIHFNNKIVENDSVNPIDLTNIYNGGGVGIGDFNNDGLEDIYFTGNQVANKLYLNKGNFKFQDVTGLAKVNGGGKWCRGISVIDINNDGLMDMYVSATILADSKMRENLLYVNQGIDKDGIPHFEDKAAEYNLNDSSYSTMAAFFDYDNDGDLDVYITVNEILEDYNPSVYRFKIVDGSFPSTGRLYRNDWNNSLKHPVFVNVTKQAGVTIEGYGHATTIADFNKDGWKDIFVTNDFNSNDLLYINNHDGTFTDKATSYFAHTSANGMGQDVIDINNDGLSDVIELDMNPEDNLRKKMMLGANSYQNYQNSDFYNYQYQYVRNTLQLNQGPRVNEGDSIGDPIFSDIAFFSGIAETDWSWTPLVQDFDNDGFRDIIVTNGYPKDITDRDFISFRQQSSAIASKDFVLGQIPQVKLHNYGFRNNGDITFSNATYDWGMDIPSFSNGGAYVDLDNDGDMDFVINNINDEAFIYKNTLMNNRASDKRYLTVKLIGDSLNRNGFGTWIELYYDGKKQVLEQTPYRGYLSSVQIDAHFGLGNASTIDSVVIKWQNGKEQMLQNIAANQTLTVNIKDATVHEGWELPVLAPNTLFTEVTNAISMNYKDSAKDFVDFNIQKLLPHKFSEYGPSMAVGDVDNNGFDDIVIGGYSGVSPSLLLQQGNGNFLTKKLIANASRENKPWQDMGIALFDADEDGDLDLVTASGGYESKPGSPAYMDKFFINDGKGNFKIDATALPQNLTSKSCIRAADYDHDGDLDLFVAGRVLPHEYPKPVSSFIYRNDSKNGKVSFIDVTSSVAMPLINAGLVCDAVFSDFDNDGWQDLVLAGEWMPITFLKNIHGTFKNVTSTSNISDKKGWFTSILPGDFDNDGDIDYIAGNLGLNSFFKANAAHPVSIYAKDFDNNGNYDAIPTIFLPTSQQDTTLKEFPVHTRDDIIKQMISFRSKFQNYKSFANASFDQMFAKDEMKDVLKVQANYFNNSYIRNDGDGKFAITSLPASTQFSCMNGMLSEDFDHDGYLDVLMIGNDYGTDVSVGRYDACNGSLLKGNGKGSFEPMSILKSGWFVPGNAKALVKLRTPNGKCLLVASKNKSSVQAFLYKPAIKTIAVNPTDVSAVITLKNGQKQKKEFYYGVSFLSQSGRFLNIDENIASISITDSKGNIRQLLF
jgi:hypothetical protein